MEREEEMMGDRERQRQRQRQTQTLLSSERSEVTGSHGPAHRAGHRCISLRDTPFLCLLCSALPGPSPVIPVSEPIVAFRYPLQ
jgi:hypothetical protein